MDIYLLDESFTRVDIVEKYQSFIWTERYDEHGDALMLASLKDHKISDFPIGYYFEDPKSKDLMRIRTAERKWDPDIGTHLEFTAKAATSFLEQRRIWSQTDVTLPLDQAVRKIITENAITPTNNSRVLPGLSYATAGATVPTVFQIEAQLGPDQNLYEAVSDMCEIHDIGFRVIHLGNGQFQFQLYGGVDRSYRQSSTPHVVFSPEFDNLEKASFFASMEPYANVVLVGGEGDGDAKKYRTVNRTNSNITGLDRYEHYTTANSKSSNGDKISAAKYNAYLDSVGRAYLKDNGMQNVFEGETDPEMSAGYGSTYLLGDIVQISDGDSINGAARVVEYIRSDDDQNGTQSFPALRILE